MRPCLYSPSSESLLLSIFMQLPYNHLQVA
jgi:hypothetical protein